MLPVSRLTLNVGHNRIQNYCGCIPRCPSMTDIVPYISLYHILLSLKGMCVSKSEASAAWKCHKLVKKTSLWPHPCAKKTPIWLVVDLPL